MACLTQQGQGASRHESRRCVEGVSAQDARHPTQHDIADGPTADSGDDSQEDRGQPAEASVKRLLCSDRGPAAESDRVDDRPGPIPHPSSHTEQKADQRTEKSREQIGVVGQRDRWALLEEDIADHAATQAGEHGKRAETDQVETFPPRDDATQQGISEDSDKI